MSLQQIIGLAIIIFFLARVLSQKRKNQLNAAEFNFWLAFWLIAGAAVALLKQIDRSLAQLGFSASGINFLLCLSVAVLFYFIFRLRLQLAKMEGEITKIVKKIALGDKPADKK